MFMFFFSLAAIWCYLLSTYGQFGVGCFVSFRFVWFRTSGVSFGGAGEALNINVCSMYFRVRSPNLLRSCPLTRYLGTL